MAVVEAGCGCKSEQQVGKWPAKLNNPTSERVRLTDKSRRNWSPQVGRGGGQAGPLAEEANAFAGCMLAPGSSEVS